MKYSIGHLSERCDVKVPTIRFYEEIGLMPKPIRTAANRREYDTTSLQQLHFIKHARLLGFEIDDIKELIMLKTKPSQSCEKADLIALKTLLAIDEKIQSLMKMKSEVKALLESCSKQDVQHCSVIGQLSNDALCERLH
jgi:DNA-binding transcriptional MerR regulator